jgi:hypothetical protein
VKICHDLTARVCRDRLGIDTAVAASGKHNITILFSLCFLFSVFWSLLSTLCSMLSPQEHVVIALGETQQSQQAVRTLTHRHLVHSSSILFAATCLLTYPPLTSTHTHEHAPGAACLALLREHMDGPTAFTAVHLLSLWRSCLMLRYISVSKLFVTYFTVLYTYSVVVDPG